MEFISLEQIDTYYSKGMTVKPVTVVLHGNDATGKTTLCRAVNDAGYLCFTRGDTDPKHDVDVKALDALTLQLPVDGRQQPKSVYTVDGIERRIVRIVLDADIKSLQHRIASRPKSDEWESEKALFYFRARFKELAAFFGFPIVRTDDGKSISDTVSEIISYIEKPDILGVIEGLKLQTLTLERVYELANVSKPVDGVDYAKRLSEIVEKECSETSLFSSSDVHEQCSRDPTLAYNIVNSYDRIFAPTFLHTSEKKVPVSLRLVTEGESKQVYRVETAITDYFSNHLFVVLKPTIYSHSMQATAEIPHLSSIRAQGSRLFLEMFHRSGVEHTYEGINQYGIVYVRATKTTPIETVYKAMCLGTDKHSFYGMRDSSAACLETGEYRGGPYVRFDWRNPNHTYNGVNVADHPFYHLMEKSVGKEPFYVEYLTKRAKPVGDKCVPEDLVPPFQHIENAQLITLRTYLTIQWYLNEIGLEVQDGCILVDRDGLEAWSEINQDCMRIKWRIPPSGQGADGSAFDKDIWRAGGSSAKDKITAKWVQLNELLGSYLSSHSFHTNEMLTTDEPYGLVAQRILSDSRFSLLPKYKGLYHRLISHDRLSNASISLKTYRVGITCSKYADKSDSFVLSHLGIRLIRPSGRCLRYKSEVVDEQKFKHYFGTHTVVFVPMKPKDMPHAMEEGMIDFTVSYNSVIDNFPPTSTLLYAIPDPDIKLALISRIGAKIDVQQWSKEKPARIIVEHPIMVKDYLNKLGISEEVYSLQHVSGSSESYLANDNKGGQLLCDAVVSSGRTLVENGLETWHIIKDKGDLTVGLYKSEGI